MSIALILLNVVFSLSVITVIVGLLLRGIAVERREHGAAQRSAQRWAPAASRPQSLTASSAAVA